jgi:beta-ribofuranosylaminobenzene 5'-phosphate synthase
MVNAPGVVVAATPAAQWSAAGPLAERALAYARTVAGALPQVAMVPQHIQVEAASPEHKGLGTGTQLGLAVARAVTVAAGLEHLAAVDLARLAGRGARSALGVHGFACGGFLVEAGKLRPQMISPLVARLPFPKSWCVVLFLPSRQAGLHGIQEQEAFKMLLQSANLQERVNALCRITLLEMLPALADEDLAAFGEALYEFNRKAGEAFAPVQHGCYAHASIAELVSFLRKAGVQGVGQSSWGPAVFAVTASREIGQDVAERARRRFDLSPAEIALATAVNEGARTEMG